MLDVFKDLAHVAVPIFVVSTMLNVGLTQTLADILRHLTRWRFVAKMLVANFVVVPLLMILALCAGAPFLIKLAQRSQHDIALAAAVMMLLMVVTVVYVQFVLPLVLE